jgi:hypothetical protein
VQNIHTISAITNRSVNEGMSSRPTLVSSTNVGFAGAAIADTGTVADERFP